MQFGQDVVYTWNHNYDNFEGSRLVIKFGSLTICSFILIVSRMLHQILLVLVVTCNAANGQSDNGSVFSWTNDIHELDNSTQQSLQQLADLMEQRVEQAMEQVIKGMLASLAEAKKKIVSDITSQVLLFGLNDIVKNVSSQYYVDKENVTKEIVSEVSRNIKEHLSLPRQCTALSNIGKCECYPAKSCHEIKEAAPNSTSGYYYIKPTTGPTVRVYCKMTSCKGVDGPWMRVVDFNADNTCPSGLQLFTNIRRRCGMPSDGAGCASTMFDVHGISYQKVCGKVIGYQEGSTDAFARRIPISIDGNYIDGVSLTHGHNPRHHIWTFVAAVDESGTHAVAAVFCPCIHSSGSAASIPSFVGSSYFCDTGTRSRFQLNTLYSDDPLWDGAGCGGSSTCCSFNRPPWFMKQLSSSTSDDLELRVCRNELRSNEDVSLKSVELYVQ